MIIRYPDHHLFAQQQPIGCAMLNAALKIAIVVLTFYVAFVALLYVLQRKMTYFPDTTVATPARHGVGEMTVIAVTTADGLALAGWYAAPTQGKAVVVLFHGNAGHLGHRAFKARGLIDAGYGVLLVGYRGYGGNPGQPDEDGLYADGRAFLDYLNVNRVGRERIVMYGESLGTGVAVQMAVEGRGAGLVLESPYTSLPDVAAHHYWWVPVRFLMNDQYSSAQKIDQIAMPLLIVHGGLDGTIPISNGETLYALAREPKTFKTFAAAGHNDVHQRGGGTAILEFLAGF